MNQNIPLGLSYEDVLLVPQYSEVKSRSDVDLSTQVTPRIRLKLPLISINMSDVTEEDMAISLGKLGGIGLIHRFVSYEKQADMVSKVKKKNVLVGAAVGIRNDYIERTRYLVKAGVDLITIDVAHGSLKTAVDATAEIKRRFGKDIDLISGVVATEDGAERLFKAGADAVRVGVGPGTICTTRIQTGVGVPQITGILEAAKSAKRHKKIILADGGTKTPGDVMKGLAAGASAVIIGSQFAGCNEAPGKLVVKNRKKYKQYNASTSVIEKKNHVKKLNHIGKDYLKYIEGVKSLVPYKGKVAGVVSKIEAGIRSGFSYCGAENLNQLWEKAQFVRVSVLGRRENGSHGVIAL
jgi:IMP dehydrogenase